MLIKRDKIMSMVTSRSRKTTHNYDTEMDTDIEHPKRLDAKNGNTFWIKAIKKDMYAVGIKLEILDEKSPIMLRNKKVTTHVVFDVKIGLTRDTH